MIPFIIGDGIRNMAEADFCLAIFFYLGKMNPLFNAAHAFIRPDGIHDEE